MSHIIKTHTYCLLPIRSLTNMAQKSKDEKQTYEHYIKPVKVIDNFEEVYKLEHRLIRSYDELYNFYKNEFKPNTFFAWDTETTSLNAEQGAKTGDLVEGKIVGYSFTQDGHIGYYVPVSHPDYSLGYKALKILYAMICRSKLNLLYNCRFDMRFLEAMTPEKYDYTPEPDEKIYKFDLSGIKYIDVQNTVWLADTNLAMPSLKKSEKHFLGWNPPTFSETIGDESNFGYLPAEQGYKYASIDALGTYHLFFKTEKYYTESGAAAKLDNDLLYPLMRLENTPINVDHDYLQSMRGDVLKHLEELKKYLFETAGREYNINSGRELVTVFQQLGIDTGKRTKTGIMETNIKAIEGYVASHGDSEYLSKLIEYKKLLKFDNSYLEKMLEMSEAENVAKHPIRFCYFTNRVPTGRLASGTDGKNSFFSKLNFQSIPKPHSHNYHVHKATPEQIANGEDLCGYIFNDDPEGSLGLAEGQDPHLNVRKAFCPIDNDSVVVSVDMCAEELRLVANIYKEQTWIKAFNSGQDVHRSTACKIFGEENYCKEARKKAKCISGDSLLYTDMGIIKIRDVNPNRIEGLPIDVDFNISTPEGVCRCSKFIYNGIKKTLKFTMNNGYILEVTPDHLVRSDNKWVRADSLHIGDYIDFEPTAIDSNTYQNINLSYIKEYNKHYMIESIEESNSDVYDLTIENESHSFLANGFVVHNCASFGILYGSSAYGFHNQFPDMTLEECEEFIEKFKAALPSIEAGQKASVRYAKKNGFVKTYFGRPRRVKYYLNHPDRSMRSFGERTVKNTAVQGAAGDCLKLMLIRLWKELFSKYPEIKWVGSIHDEITYIIPKSILIDALKIIKKCQTIKLPDWPVQLDCDISIGKSFGELIPWFLDDETGELTPQLEEIKHEQAEEKSENKVNEYDMLLDADEYDYLQ